MQFYSIQFQAAEAIRIGALLAQPFMPVKANEILEVMGVDPSRRYFTFAFWGADRQYGPSRTGQKVHQVFPRMKEEEEEEGKESMEDLRAKRRAEKLAKRQVILDQNAGKKLFREEREMKEAASKRNIEVSMGTLIDKREEGIL